MSDETDPAVATVDGVDSTTPKPKRRRRGGRGRGGSRRAVQTRVAEEDGAASEAVSDVTDGRLPGGVASLDEGPVAEIGQAEADTAETGGSEGRPATRRPRRRGGRGRRRKPGVETGAAEAGPAKATMGDQEPSSSAESVPGAEPADIEGTESTAGDGQPRRRRPTSRGRAKAKPAEAEKPEKPRRARAKPKAEPRAEQAESAGGPTRIRRARTLGRRRREPAPVIRRTRDKVMVITENGERDQIAVLEDRELVQHFVTRAGARSMVGNVYLGRVQNVLPGMEAAFVDIGRGRNAVLYAGEVNYPSEDVEGPPPRIEQVLKAGQAVLVQVTKDPIGGKGARLTAEISMPGRYLVLVPNSTVSGISRRLPDNERRRLKAVVKRIEPEGHGLIVRTAAEGAGEEALAADVARLLEEWAGIEQRAKRAKAPHMLYEDPELTVRVVRDVFTDEEFRELVTDSPRINEKVTDYLRGVAPDLVEKVHLHQGKLPAFEEYHVVEQIHKALDRKVWLPSGGYIIIERTEAMTVIDVNTGKHVGKSNLEETVVATNLEAALEVARQLRLRDIGGIIIIDFIDMLLEQNKKKVVETLRDALAQDKTRSQVFDIGPLGLLEVTRKRVSAGLLESFSETCPTCEGRGVLLTYEM